MELPKYFPYKIEKKLIQNTKKRKYEGFIPPSEIPKPDPRASTESTNPKYRASFIFISPDTSKSAFVESKAMSIMIPSFGMYNLPNLLLDLFSTLYLIYPSNIKKDPNPINTIQLISEAVLSEIYCFTNCPKEIDIPRLIIVIKLIINIEIFDTLICLIP